MLKMPFKIYKKLNPNGFAANFSKFQYVNVGKAFDNVPSKKGYLILYITERFRSLILILIAYDEILGYFL